MHSSCLAPCKLQSEQNNAHPVHEQRVWKGLAAEPGLLGLLLPSGCEREANLLGWLGFLAPFLCLRPKSTRGWATSADLACLFPGDT